MPYPHIVVEVSPSGMRATVTVQMESNKNGQEPDLLPSAEEILGALSEAGVIFGIDEKAVSELVEKQRWREKVIVARGMPPQAGQNGYVSYLFDINQKPHPKEMADGRVDYREIGLVNFVKKDSPLARRVLATKGLSGTTVRGDTLPTKDGEDVRIKAGPNTYFPNGNDLELRAEISGSVSLKAGCVQVESSLLMKKGVNFATGNVDFPGDIVVQGDIMSGFMVKSGGNIEVRGVVEDAYLDAGGDVLVKGGFKGSGRGRIKAKGEVYVKFVENQMVEADGSIHIGQSCINADIIAGNKIGLSTASGTVIGGHLRAAKGITAKVLGNPQCTTTVVEIVGDTSEFDARLEAMKKELEICREKIARLRSIVIQLQLLKTESASEDPKLLAEIQKCQDDLYHLSTTEESLDSEANRLQAAGCCPGEVVVLKRIYPGVRIILCSVMLLVEEESERTTFVRVGDEVVDATAKAVSLI